MKNIYLAGLSFLLGSTFSISQTITNGDMESWPAGCPYNTAPDSWLNYTVGSSSLGPDQAGACYGSVSAYEGDSYMNMVYTGSAEEGAEYILGGLTAGFDYTLTFYARNTNGIYASSGSGSIDVFHNGSVVYSTPELTAPGSWAMYTADFTAITSMDNIGFRVRPGTGSSGSFGIDAVSVAGGPVSGIETEETISFSIYPNATNEVLNMIFEGVETAEVSMYDLQGRRIVHYSELPPKIIQTVDISSVPNGLYVVRLSTTSGIIERKIVID